MLEFISFPGNWARVFLDPEPAFFSQALVLSIPCPQLYTNNWQFFDLFDWYQETILFFTTKTTKKWQKTKNMSKNGLAERLSMSNLIDQEFECLACFVLPKKLAGWSLREQARFLSLNIRDGKRRDNMPRTRLFSIRTLQKIAFYFKQF